MAPPAALKAISKQQRLVIFLCDILPGSPIHFSVLFIRVRLDINDWVNAGTSRFLKELEEASGKTAPKELSVKFNVDAL